MAFKEPVAVGSLAEFAKTLSIMSTQGMPVENVKFDFLAAIVSFTHQGTQELFRLEPGQTEDEFIIKFPRARMYTIASTRKKFWRLVLIRYYDLDFPEMEPELEIELEDTRYGILQRRRDREAISKETEALFRRSSK